MGNDWLRALKFSTWRKLAKKDFVRESFSQNFLTIIMKKYLITNFKLFKRTLFFSTLSVFRIEIHLKKRGTEGTILFREKKREKVKLIRMESLLANSIKRRKEVEDWRSGRRIERVAAKSSLSLYKLQILGGKPLGNLLISFNAIFRKIYTRARARRVSPKR